MDWGVQHMSDEKKTIIIKEIHNWKENHLLPEKYCDYLLALYTQGDSTELEFESNNLKESPKISMLHVLLFIVNIFVLPITFIVLYFTDFNINLQVSIGIFLVMFSLFIYYVIRKKVQYLHYYSFFILLLTLLLTSIGILQRYTNHFALLNAVASVQLLTWGLIGVLKKRILLISIGSIGFIITIILFLF